MAGTSIATQARLHHITASVLFLIAFALLYWLQLQSARSLAESPADIRAVDNLRLMDMMHDALHADVLNALRAGDRQDAAHLSKIQEETEEHAGTFEQAIGAATKEIRDTESRAAVTSATPKLQAYARLARSIVNDAANNFSAAQGRLAAFQQSFEALEGENDQLVSKIRNQAVARSLEGKQMLGVASWVLLALFIVSVFDRYFGIRRAVVFARPLREASAFADAIAAGNLGSRDISVKAGGETGRLLDALRHMRSQLAGLVGEVRGSAQALGTAAEELRAGSTDLSQRTEEQAASLEQTAASVDQLTSTVRQNAENAAEASRLAQQAAQLATRGGDVVGQVVSTMGGIQESSRKIAEINSVIDGIAFQTNILALNAAVEAARAGEQGRGFAVVAAEVRALAQRSASAAKEISALIANSVQQVDSGSKLVGTAGQSIDEIVTAVRQVSDIISGIANASREQSLGIQQVSQTVGQLEQVTQQNAAVVEEVSAASESLKDQAQGLVRAVSAFSIGTAAAATSAAARPATTASTATRELIGSTPSAHRPPAATTAKQSTATSQTTPKRASDDASDEWTEF